jgi:hypothetical protein
MRVAAFFFAQQTNVDDGLFCSGGFREIVTYDSYPVTSMMPFVIVLEETPTNEAQTFDLEVQVFAQGDIEVSDVYRGTLTLDPRHPESPVGLPGFMLSALPVEVSTPEPGMYRAVLRVDQEEVAEYLFHARMS